MDSNELVYWLHGYLEDRESLTNAEVQRIRLMLGNIVAVPPEQPSDEQVEKMVNTLFPDVKGDPKKIFEFKNP